MNADEIAIPAEGEHRFHLGISLGRTQDGAWISFAHACLAALRDRRCTEEFSDFRLDILGGSSMMSIERINRL